MSGLTLEDATSSLLETLTARQAEITWAGSFIQLYDLIRTTYSLYNVADPPECATDLAAKVKDVERLVTLDLQRHLAISNGREQFYISNFLTHLQRALDALQSLDKDLETWPERRWGHVTAELQATLVEYGCCRTLGAIYDVGEANMKLDALSSKMDKIQVSGADVSIPLGQLQDAVAEHHGIQQAMTQTNLDRLQKRFDQLQGRLFQLEQQLCGADKLRPDSEFIIQYLAGHHLLSKPFLDSFYHDSCTATVNSHMIHPGTRGWLLDRISRCVANPSKRMFVLSGKQGSGKTAMSSAVCKLLNHNLLACHFFESSHKSGSSIKSSIHNLAYGMCHTLPEYLNYLDDKAAGGELKKVLSGSYQENYEALIRIPLQSLYGTGSNPRRCLLVLDAVDECSSSEWSDLTVFLKSLIKDLPSNFCLFVTVRNKYFSSLIPTFDCHMDSIEGVCLEDRAWVNRHIKDLELYLSSSLGAILSGEDERDTPRHAKSDVSTLQKAIDELLKLSSGRFDYAVELMESFAREMTISGQFLSSLKKATLPVQRHHGNVFEQKMGTFASPYRAYRDKEGRSVDVRVMRQSHYLMDKTRAALIRGRHLDFNENGQAQ